MINPLPSQKIRTDYDPRTPGDIAGLKHIQMIDGDFDMGAVCVTVRSAITIEAPAEPIFSNCIKIKSGCQYRFFLPPRSGNQLADVVGDKGRTVKAQGGRLSSVFFAGGNCFCSDTVGGNNRHADRP